MYCNTLLEGEVYCTKYCIAGGIVLQENCVAIQFDSSWVVLQGIG